MQSGKDESDSANVNAERISEDRVKRWPLYWLAVSAIAGGSLTASVMAYFWSEQVKDIRRDFQHEVSSIRNDFENYKKKIKFILNPNKKGEIDLKKLLYQSGEKADFDGMKSILFGHAYAPTSFPGFSQCYKFRNEIPLRMGGVIPGKKEIDEFIKAMKVQNGITNIAELKAYVWIDDNHKFSISVPANRPFPYRNCFLYISVRYIKRGMAIDNIFIQELIRRKELAVEGGNISYTLLSVRRVGRVISLEARTKILSNPQNKIFSSKPDSARPISVLYLHEMWYYFDSGEGAVFLQVFFPSQQSVKEADPDYKMIPQWMTKFRVVVSN